MLDSDALHEHEAIVLALIPGVAVFAHVLVDVLDTDVVAPCLREVALCLFIASAKSIRMPRPVRAAPTSEKKPLFMHVLCGTHMMG